MDFVLHLGAPALYCCDYLVMLLSALFPWVNGEAAMLALWAAAGPQGNPIPLALVGTAGQMTGKCVLYWMARRASSALWPSLQRGLRRWQPRLSRSGAAVPALMLASATFGIPPFYATSVVAGALKIRFGLFAVIGICGRFLHFGGLILVPQLAVGHLI
jgi:membrane protein YqaA with SNARE-associated domain